MDAQMLGHGEGQEPGQHKRCSLTMFIFSSFRYHGPFTGWFIIGFLALNKTITTTDVEVVNQLAAHEPCWILSLYQVYIFIFGYISVYGATDCSKRPAHRSTLHSQPSMKTGN